MNVDIIWNFSTMASLRCVSQDGLRHRLVNSCKISNITATTFARHIDLGCMTMLNQVFVMCVPDVINVVPTSECYAMFIRFFLISHVCFV